MKSKIIKAIHVHKLKILMFLHLGELLLSLSKRTGVLAPCWKENLKLKHFSLSWNILPTLPKHNCVKYGETTRSSSYVDGSKSNIIGLSPVPVKSRNGILAFNFTASKEIEQSIMEKLQFNYQCQQKSLSNWCNLFNGQLICKRNNRFKRM